jgi:hypothetical protein
MKTILKLTAAILSLYVALNGCAVNELDKPAPFSPTSVVIATSMEAAQAFASVLQARDLFITSTNLFKNLGGYSLGIMATDPTLAGKNTDIDCADGGTYKYDGTTTGGSYDLTVTFNGCRDKKFQYAGKYTVTGGTPTNITVKLGDSSTTFNIFYFNSAYTVLVDYLKAQSSFTMTGSGTATDAVYTITPSGKITTFDYFLLDTFTMTYSGATTGYTLSTDPVTGDQTTSISTDGNLSQTSFTRGLTITLSGFTVERIKRYNAGAGSFYADDTSLSGTAAFNYRPNNYCFEGSYTVATTTPVHTDYGLGHTTQGTLTLNGVATAQYNPGGDIDVSVTGSTPLSYAEEYALMKVCDYSAMEENTPPLLGPTGTAVGSTMAVTLTWTGPGGISTSDMDLHVKYYNTTTPGPSTPPTWHIDWHQGKTCTDPAGLVFGDAFDLNADGRCDVGLDFDNTTGYGPEHITALRLPTGYYVVSVDSYSLHGDASATLYLSLHIGDNIFGPYIGTLSTDDGEGTDPSSWFRVADVRVNADGTVDILRPDGTLNPWGH